jgi:predicted molibdopterin-dependent oxidoreductase YjgC
MRRTVLFDTLPIQDILRHHHCEYAAASYGVAGRFSWLFKTSQKRLHQQVILQMSAKLDAARWQQASALQALIDWRLLWRSGRQQRNAH